MIKSLDERYVCQEKSPDYDFVYRKITHKLSPVYALCQQLTKAVSFYSAFYPEKVKQLQEYKGLLAIKHTKSSIPDTVGVMTGLLNFDSVKEYGCKRVFQHLAHVLHPDKSGNNYLFDFCRRAYTAGDVALLNAVKRYIDSKKTQADIQELEHFVSVRCQVLLEYFKSLPVYELLKLDVYAGVRGENEQAKIVMGTLLDKAIVNAQQLLLKE